MTIIHIHAQGLCDILRAGGDDHTLALHYDGSFALVIQYLGQLSHLRPTDGQPSGTDPETNRTTFVSQCVKSARTNDHRVSV